MGNRGSLHICLEPAEIRWGDQTNNTSWNILKSRGIAMKLGQTGQWTWSELILFENRAIQDETGFTPGQIDRLHTRFFLTFLQCVRIKMLKMFMYLSMPQSKLSMTSIKSNLNWIWRVSDLFYWELSPFTVWRWHAQENEHQSNVIQTEFGVSAFCFVKRTFTIRNLFPRFRKLDVGNNGYLQRQVMQLICTKRTRSSFDPNVLFLE